MSRMDAAADLFLESIYSGEELRHDAAVRRVVERSERIVPNAIAPFLAPLVLRWGPSDTGRWPIARSGRGVMLRACAETPPSSGPATITLTVLTEFSGVESITTLTIPQGQQFGAKALPATDPLFVFPAGAWIGAAVTTANGASGVSIALTVNIGGTT